jgi:phage-related protein
MAGPGGTEVGRVSVKVVPDVDGFRQKVKEELETVDGMEATVKVELDLTEFKAQIEEVKALLKSISDESVKINIDQSGAAGGLGKLGDDLKKSAKEAEGLGKKLKDVVDGDDEKRLGKFASLTQSLGQFMGQAANAASNLAGQAGSALASGLQSAGSSLTSLILSMVLWIPLLSGAAGAILFLGGAIAAGLGGLPVALTALGAPIAAVILGFDGIKKAAAQLGPEVDKLKARLSGTFAKELTPVFAQLKQLFPVISDGLNGAAKGVSALVGELVKVVTSTKNVENLKNAFQGVQDFLTALTPGVGKFIDSLLQIAGATKFYKIFGETISDVLTRLRGFFDQSFADGSLEKGLTNLKGTLTEVTGMFSSLARNALKFFNGSAPGINKFFGQLSTFFLKIDWERLGKAFGSIFQLLGQAIAEIPPQTIEDITSAFEGLASSVGALVSGKSFDVIISAFTAFIKIVRLAIDTINFFLEAFAAVGDFFSSIPDQLSSVSDAFGTLFDALGTIISARFQGILDFFSGIGDKIKGAIGDAATFLITTGKEWIDGLALGITGAFFDVQVFFLSIPGKVNGFFAGVGGWLRDKGTQLINGLRDGVVTAFNAVIGFFQSIPSRISGFFANAGSWLLGAGRSIIDGLVSGISSAFGRVTSILGKLTALIPTWKGPLSVDKVLLTKNGKVIMQSLQDGLTQGFQPVQSLLDGMTNDIASTFDSSSLTSDMRVSGSDIAAVGTSQLSVAGNVTGVSAEIVDAMTGWQIVIDPTGVARLVNKGSQKLARRK